VPVVVNRINRSGYLMLPAAVIPFSIADTGARHGEAMINCDLSFLADANARCGKRKMPVTVNSCVVVFGSSPCLGFNTSLCVPMRGKLGWILAFSVKNEK